MYAAMARNVYVSGLCAAATCAPGTPSGLLVYNGLSNIAGFCAPVGGQGCRFVIWDNWSRFQGKLLARHKDEVIRFSSNNWAQNLHQASAVSSLSVR